MSSSAKRFSFFNQYPFFRVTINEAFILHWARVLILRRHPQKSFILFRAQFVFRLVTTRLFSGFSIRNDIFFHFLISTFFFYSQACFHVTTSQWANNFLSFKEDFFICVLTKSYLYLKVPFIFPFSSENGFFTSDTYRSWYMRNKRKKILKKVSKCSRLAETETPLHSSGYSNDVQCWSCDEKDEQTKDL